MLIRETDKAELKVAVVGKKKNLGLCPTEFRLSKKKKRKKKKKKKKPNSYLSPIFHNNSKIFYNFKLKTRFAEINTFW